LGAIWQESWILDHFEIFVTIALKGAYGNRWQSSSVSNHGFLGHVELGHSGKCNYSLKRVGEIYITIWQALGGGTCELWLLSGWFL